MEIRNIISILRWGAVIRVIYRWLRLFQKKNSRIDAKFKTPEGGVPKIPVCMTSY